MIRSDSSPPPSTARRPLGRLRRFLARPAGEKWLVVRAGAVLLAFRLALLLFEFGTLRRFVRRSSTRSGERSPDPARIERFVWAVWSASRLIPTGRNCLLRSLAVCWMLGREGIRSDLRIGVRSGEEEGFAAHAWVEVDGRVVTRELAGVEPWAAFDGCVLGDSRTS